MKSISEKLKLPEWFESHALVQKIKGDKQAETLAKRQAAAAAIERLNKEGEALSPLLSAKVEKLQGELAEADKQALTIREKTCEARRELTGARVRIPQEIGVFEAILLGTYDPGIDEAITFFRDKLDDLRKPGKINHIGRAGENNLVNLTKTVTSESNVEALNAALAYCMASIRRLEALKLSPALDLQEIEKLKNGIPSIDVYTEFSGTKALPGSKDVNPLHLLKSDEELALDMEKITKKFKKLIGR